MAKKQKNTINEIPIIKLNEVIEVEQNLGVVEKSVLDKSSEQLKEVTDSLESVILSQEPETVGEGSSHEIKETPLTAVTKNKVKSKNKVKKKITVKYDELDDSEVAKSDEGVRRLEGEQQHEISSSADMQISTPVNIYKKRRAFGRIFYLIPLTIFIIGGLTLGKAKTYSGKVMPGLSFLGQDLSGKTFDEAKKIIDDRVASYKVNLMYDAKSNLVDATKVGLEFKTDEVKESLKTAKRKNLFDSLVNLKRQDLALNNSFELGTLKKFLADEYKDGSVAKDAEIYFNNDTGQFETAAEIVGVGIDSEQLGQKIQDDAMRLTSNPIIINLTQLKPKLTTAKIEEVRTRANEILNTSVVINGPNGQYSPYNSDKQNWLNIVLNDSGDSYEIRFNDEVMSNYVAAVVGENNRSKQDRSVINTGGGTLVLSEGRNGISVNNQDFVTNNLINNFHAGIATNLSLTYDTVAMNTQDFAQVNGRWVYADLSQFRVYAYEGNTLVNSFAMSSGAPNFPTVTGVFNVWTKVRTQTMRGGSGTASDPFYSVPNVEYIAYFYGSYALHGVWWHNAFGYSNRSHGCIGMSNANAEWMYNFVDIGTPVVVVN